MSWAKKINEFNSTLELGGVLPKGIDVMNPFQKKYTRSLSATFYTKYYNDTNSRVMILGINPGRFGAGLTGIPFTDPIKLELICAIENTLSKKAELSADFIYAVIESFGVTKFYQQFYFSSVCPLGFTKNGKNLNYYDDKKLQKTVKPFIVSSMKTQIGFGMNTKNCYCLGEGKNYVFLNSLNDEYGFFQNIIPLPHPRYIMQYRRKKLNDYVLMYTEKLNFAIR